MGILRIFEPNPYNRLLYHGVILFPMLKRQAEQWVFEMQKLLLKYYLSTDD